MNKRSEKELWEQAKLLASRPYAIEVIELDQEERERFPDDVCVTNPELPGCYSEGSTWEEAQENLQEARELYIFTLLKTGEPVPSPFRAVEIMMGGNYIIDFAKSTLQQTIQEQEFHIVQSADENQKNIFTKLKVR